MRFSSNRFISLHARASSHCLRGLRFGRYSIASPGVQSHNRTEEEMASKKGGSKNAARSYKKQYTLGKKLPRRPRGTEEALIRARETPSLHSELQASDRWKRLSSRLLLSRARRSAFRHADLVRARLAASRQRFVAGPAARSRRRC